MHQKQEDSDPIPVKIFYFYSDEEDKREKEAKQRLDRHLDTLKRITGVHLINSWVDAGQEWEEIIDENLNKADIIILLISPDFMHSDYCFEKVQIALAMHHQEKTLVIPVHFRSTTMTDEFFSALQMLPANKIPVKSWTHIDDACAEVVEGIKLAIKAIRLKPEVLRIIAHADKLFLQENYEQALSSYQSAWSILEKTSFNKSIVHVLWHMGNAHSRLEHYEEALEAYDKAIAIDPQIEFYKEKSNVLVGLRRYKEVIEACKIAINLIKPGEEQSVVAQIYLNKGFALARSADFKNALLAFENALTLDVNNGIGWRWKGMIHARLKEGEEAKNAYLKAITLQPNDASLRKLYADLLLLQLQDFAEARTQYSQAIRLGGGSKFTYQGKVQASRNLAAQLQQRAKELLQSAEEDEKQF